MASLLANLISGVAHRDADQRHDGAAARILDAAVLEAAGRGIDGLTAEAVARRAGVNRVTVYRRFGDRDGLIEAMAVHEGRRMADGIADAVAEVSDPVAQFVEGFVAALRIAREHPLIAREVRYEPGALVLGGLADDAALLRLGAAVVGGGIRRIQSLGGATHLDAEIAGEVIARLFAALVLMPSAARIDTSTDHAARAFARTTLVPMLLGPDRSDPEGVHDETSN